MTSGYDVASASQLRGGAPPRLEAISASKKLMEEFTQGKLKRSSAFRKSVRFTRSTIGSTGGNNEIGNVEYGDEVDISAASPDASRGIDLAPGEASKQVQTMELLMPVAYKPMSGPGQSEVDNSPPHTESGSSSASPESSNSSVDHKRNSSNSSTSSTSSRRRRRGSFELYFTPVQATKSQIYLSSPVPSPVGSPTETPTSSSPPGPDVDVDRCATPRPSARLSRPPSAIYVGTPPTEIQPGGFTPPEKDMIRVTQTQLNSLIHALAQSRMIQKHVRKDWFELEDVPDDQSTISGASLPSLTSASTLYSRQNVRFDEQLASKVQIPSPCSELQRSNELSPTTAQGGITLCDPKIHGTPARYVSKDYRIGTHTIDVDTCQHLDTPAGPEVECSLRIEAPSHPNSSCKVLLRCINEIVDRKSGKPIYLLSADIDVTTPFTKAALAELANTADKPPSQISLTPKSPTTPLASPDIDWVALADDLQLTSETTDLLETTLSTLPILTEESSSMATLALKSTLTLLADHHQDLLILRPTSYHSNGRPANVRIPYVSQRLYEDWYLQKKGKKVAPGFTEAARRFQMDVVRGMGKRALEEGPWNFEVFWKGQVRQVVHGVKVEGKEGEVLWLCFVRGEFGDIEM